MASPGYLPISAYGAIGDLRTVALIGNNGSIDWCCFPEIDDPGVQKASPGRLSLGPLA